MVDITLNTPFFRDGRGYPDLFVLCNLFPGLGHYQKRAPFSSRKVKHGEALEICVSTETRAERQVIEAILHF